MVKKKIKKFVYPLDNYLLMGVPCLLVKYLYMGAWGIEGCLEGWECWVKFGESK
jgi:hypothetical protein